jgi:hypothetical protein
MDQKGAEIWANSRIYILLQGIQQTPRVEKGVLLDAFPEVFQDSPARARNAWD